MNFKKATEPYYYYEECFSVRDGRPNQPQYSLKPKPHPKLSPNSIQFCEDWKK